ncbi:hypothetical protein AB4084_13525, partial [Lysobacter sp. 2RAB21]
ARAIGLTAPEPGAAHAGRMARMQAGSARPVSEAVTGNEPRRKSAMTAQADAPDFPEQAY